MQIEEEALNTLNNHVPIFYWIMKNKRNYED